jgi:3-methyladenine DNA glycosylase AlkD
MRYPINSVFPRGATTVPDLRKAAKSWATQNKDATVKDLAESGNINKRRAAAVLILITKAVSWLLRNLVKHYRTEVEAYLRSNEGRLPAIAVRETFNKLKTGRKSGK